jgi:tetratricopeptide (TPR) repeat protein
LEPEDPFNHCLLAGALEFQGKLDDAAASYREAIRHKADYADAHIELGRVLTFQGALDLAVAECRQAVRLRPDVAEYHVILGHALNAQHKKEEAIAEHRLAQRLNPDYAEAHCSLGLILYQNGDYAGAAVEVHAGQEVRKRSGLPSSQEDLNLLAVVDRMAALGARLPAVVKGDDRPSDIDDLVAFAAMAAETGFYSASVRLWQRALDLKPDVADNRQFQHRYNAACSAALAAAGKGENEPPENAEARVKLRTQAVAWLRAELAAWEKLLECGESQDAATIVFTLQHWLEDVDLAAVHDAAALGLISADEQRAWRALWSDVDVLLAKARSKSTH